MSDYRPGDMLVQSDRGTHGIESTRGTAFRVDSALRELQSMQQEGRVDTYHLSLNRCTQPTGSASEPAQFELIAELFILYSPVWQFAVTWRAPLATGTHLRVARLNEKYFSWRPGMSALMTRVWLGDSYQRVPLACFVQADAIVTCIEFFLRTEGDRCPAIAWISDSEMPWRFHVYPEDELPNRSESLVRPASTVSLPELEVARQLGQVSFKDESAFASSPMPDPGGVLYETGSAAEVHPLVDSTIAQIRDELNRTDWSHATRFVSIFQQESRYSPLLGYVALYGHPLGILAELVMQHAQCEDHYTAFSPVALESSEQMVRIWVGMHYRRVPLARLVPPAQAIEFALAFLSRPSLQHSLLFQWRSESEHWRNRISPEDDIYDPLEPLTRIAAQTSVSSEELYARLKDSYTKVGLTAHAIPTC